MAIRMEHNGCGWVVYEDGELTAHSIHGMRTLAECSARELGRRRGMAVLVTERNGLEYMLPAPARALPTLMDMEPRSDAPLRASPPRSAEIAVLAPIDGVA